MSEAKKRFNLFVPILAGATLRDRLVACVGTLLGISLTAGVCALALGTDPNLPLLVAPIGASAVLLFAIPASPLAQPWPVIGGNTISALVGIAVAQLVPNQMAAAGLAVALAILVMSLTRSLHPPGGAAALTAVIGGAAVAKAGFGFAFIPVALNSAILVLFGVCFHWLTRRTYPHHSPSIPANVHKTTDLPPEFRVGIQRADIDAALEKMGETFDIDPGDLDRLLREIEAQILSRSNGGLLCENIMSQDVVAVERGAEAESARTLLLDHEIRTLPVIDSNKVLVGTIGLRELVGVQGSIAGHISSAITARRETSAMSLSSSLADGRTHAVIVVDDNNRVAGIITQTDLLTALARELLKRG